MSPSFVRPASLSTLSLVAASLLAAAAGCDDDAAAPGASFRAMSVAQREAALQAALGLGAVHASFALIAADADAQDQGSTCPTRTREGATSTYTAAGCAGHSGKAYAGRAVAENSPYSLDESLGVATVPVVADAPMRLSFEDFRLTDGDVTMGFDGTLTQSAAKPTGRYATELDLTVDQGAAIRIAARLDCAAPGQACTYAAGARGEVLGAGGFSLSGTFALGEHSTGALELRGADTLRLDFAAATESCVPYTIDGVEAGQLCRDPATTPPPPAPPPSSPEDRIEGSGFGCDGEALFFEADIHGAATAVRMIARRAGASVEVPLAKGTHEPTSGLDFWTGQVPAAGAALGCEDLAAAGLRVIADFPSGRQCQDSGAVGELAGVPCE